MKHYLEDLSFISTHGVSRPDRTGTGTKAVFGMQTRYDLSQSFPAVTTKKLAWKACVSELLWFLEGSSDERRLCEILHGTRDSSKTTIWTENANAPYWKPKAKFDGDLGRIYGVQWRDWRTPLDNSTILKRLKNLFKKEQYTTTDQLLDLIQRIKSDPYGRRHILSAWNPGELDRMALPPCHTLSQFFVEPLTQTEIDTSYFKLRDSLPVEERDAFAIDGHGNSREFRGKTAEDLIEIGLPTQKLSCQLYQRSGDTWLGVNLNISSYSLLTCMIAQCCGLAVGEFIWTGGDCHIYDNHADAVEEQLLREPMEPPQLWLNPTIFDITKFTMDDIKLIDYQSHPPIKAPMAV